MNWNVIRIRTVRVLAQVAILTVIPTESALAQFPDQWNKDVSSPISTSFAASTVLDHDGVFKAWGLGGPGGVRYATSADGLTWNVQPTPVLTPGVEGAYVGISTDNPSVVIVGTTYHMFYSFESTDGHSRIGHATSGNGVDWTKDAGNPVVDFNCSGTRDSSELLHPNVLYEAPVFRMWYNGAGAGTQSVFHAASIDGTYWAREPDPVVDTGPSGLWDDEQLYMIDVVNVGGTYYMFYTGSQVGGEFGIGYATSADGRAWAKSSPSVPVITPGDPGDWDDAVILAPVILETGSGFRMYYIASSDFVSFSWGFATTSGPTAAPPFRENRLGQNSPNPFNPRTMIAYELPQAARVSLKIYDAAGRQIRTLINGTMMLDGSHEAPWDGLDDDGRSVASGVYFYQLFAAGHSETKKMVLVR